MARKKIAIRPRKKPLQERSRATVDAILEAATYVLSEHGLAKTTTNLVAKRAGVNIASLYQYFPSKEALLVAVAQRHVVAVRGRALAALRSKRSRSALVRALIESLVDEHRASPALHRALIEGGVQLALGRHATELDEELARERDRLVAEVAGADLPAWIATTAAHAVVHQAVLDRPEALTSGALTEELTMLVDAYLSRRLRRQRA